MQRMEVSAAVRHIYMSLGFKRLKPSQFPPHADCVQCTPQHTTAHLRTANTPQDLQPHSCHISHDLDASQMRRYVVG